MTGTQLNYWRTSHHLTLREVEDLLDGQVNYSSLARWEKSPSDIPKWAEERILSTTKITLSLEELHELMDLAREEKQSFQELLATCIREHIARHKLKSVAENSPAISAAPDPDAVAALADLARRRSAKAAAAAVLPGRTPSAPPIRPFP